MPRTLGVAAETEGQFSRIASQSAPVSVMPEPAAAATPARWVADERTMITLEPMLEIDEAICFEAPPPISIIVITAAMPITMPSIVSSDRATLRRRATRAVLRIWSMICFEMGLLGRRGSCGGGFTVNGVNSVNGFWGCLGAEAHAAEGLP